MPPSITKTRVHRRHLPITSSLQSHSHCGKEAHYEAWVNHNTCLQHREWWRDGRLLLACCVLSAVAAGAATSAYFLEHDSERAENLGRSIKPLLWQGKVQARTKNKELESLRHQAETFIDNGDLIQGIASFKKALALCENTNASSSLKAELLNDMAVAEHAQGFEDQSIVHLEQAIDSDQQMIAAQNNLALIATASNDKDKARAALAKIKSVKPLNQLAAERLTDFLGN